MTREAEFWRGTAGRKVACSLCYRRCELADGEWGFCRHRMNEGGQMRIPHYGVLSKSLKTMLGYFVMPHFLPGLPAVMVGGIHCTAHCSFCVSMDATWDPERLSWGARGSGAGQVGQRGDDAFWNRHRYILDPAALVEQAVKYGAGAVVFDTNEPLCSFEYTYDAAGKAKARGLKVMLFTNGLSEPAVIRRMAGLVDAVNLGVKGNLSPAFYARWMKAPGGEEAVKRSALAWKQAGVFLVVSNLIPPENLLAEEEHRGSEDAFFGWVRDALGPYQVLQLSPMNNPRDRTQFLIPKEGQALDDYADRVLTSLERVGEFGMPYARADEVADPIRCHRCGGVLLAFQRPRWDCEPCTLPTHYCSRKSHEQHVTAGRCDHCGARVPVATVPMGLMLEIRRCVAECDTYAVSNRTRLSDPEPGPSLHDMASARRTIGFGSRSAASPTFPRR